MWLSVRHGGCHHLRPDSGVSSYFKNRAPPAEAGGPWPRALLWAHGWGSPGGVGLPRAAASVAHVTRPGQRTSPHCNNRSVIAHRAGLPSRGPGPSRPPSRSRPERTSQPPDGPRLAPYTSPSHPATPHFGNWPEVPIIAHFARALVIAQNSLKTNALPRCGGGPLPAPPPCPPKPLNTR